MSRITLFILLCFLVPLVNGVATYKLTDQKELHKYGDKLVGLKVTNELELTWDTPTLREDDTPLPITEIHGYVLQYWINPENVKQIDIPLVNMYSLFNLPSGTYSLHIATEDTDRQVGAFSPSITVTL